MPSPDGIGMAGPTSGRGCYALRLQLTKRCQLRCGYCRPNGVRHAEPHALGATDAARIVRLLVDVGVDRVRLTGGEPLLREDICDIVAALARLPGLREVNLTTNADRLASMADRLSAAGLTRINIHIDSLDPERFHALSGGRLDRALEGLRAAIAARLSPKLNVVVQRGANDQEIPRFVGLARELRIPVRFIELMDTGIAPEFARGRFVPGSEIAAVLEALGAVCVGRTGSAPAVDYRLPDGTVAGIIASETACFCDSCDRLRLTADGILRTCLYAAGGVDLGALARSGASDADILEAARRTVPRKSSCHPVRRAPGVEAPRFSMASIGG